MGFGVEGSGLNAKPLVVALLLTGQGAFAECAPDRADLRGAFGTARFSVELADDPKERAQGLMHREKMATSTGMLFVYDFPQAVAFWMENTLIPLDMLFFDQNGVLKKVHEHAVPLDRTHIWGGDQIQYVLEINAGLSGLLGITEGAEIRHPSIVQSNAAWSCSE